jgi:hypothetical protein
MKTNSFKFAGNQRQNLEIECDPFPRLTRMFHELQSRDREDGRATGQPQGVGPEAYLTVRRKVRHPRTPGRTAISTVAVGDS